MLAQSDDGDFTRAVELFNAGQYFASHEAWERVWRHAEGNQKRLLQGLIQAAAAMLHLERGNLRGARSLYSKAHARLEGVPDQYMDLAVAEFRVALRNFMFAALDGRPAITSPRLRRMLQLLD